MKKLFILLFIFILANGVFANKQEKQETEIKSNIVVLDDKVVQEIIDKNTFRTYNSIYRWEVIS